jgi:hypothetical protein
MEWPESANVVGQTKDVSDRINKMIRMISEILLLTYFVNSAHSV